MLNETAMAILLPVSLLRRYLGTIEQAMHAWDQGLEDCGCGVLQSSLGLGFRNCRLEVRLCELVSRSEVCSQYLSSCSAGKARNTGQSSLAAMLTT